MAPSTSPRPDRARRRPWTPAFVVVAILACGAMFGVGFGIGHALGGSGGSHPATTTLPGGAIGQDAVSTLENGLGLLKSAHQTLADHVLAILADDGRTSTCTDPADVDDKIDDAITQRTQAVEEFVGPLGDADPSAARLVGAFRRMVVATNAADRQRIAFVNSDYATWQRAGCSGPPPTDSASFSKFETASRAAQDAKRRFVADFNPIAARFGLQSDWSASDL